MPETLSSNTSSQEKIQTVPPMNKQKDGLRKGKWTIEEERFANKIIEVFNAGLLKLHDEEKGITLRAYLAAKLDCDPMRITKKYTGDSCLGKKVYHFDQKGLVAQDVENARRELNDLEWQFRSKLEQMKKSKSNNQSFSDNLLLISTPAIDALILSSKPTVPAISESPIEAFNYQVSDCQAAFLPQSVPIYPFYQFPGGADPNIFPYSAVTALSHSQNMEFSGVNDSMIYQQVYPMHSQNNSSPIFNHYIPTVPYTNLNSEVQLQPPKDVPEYIIREEITEKRRTFHEISLGEDESTEFSVKRLKSIENNHNSNVANFSPNSWIMNHLHTISSHENLLDLFDSPKSRSNSTSYETSSATKLAARESVENLLKLINPGIVIAQL